MKKIFLIIIMAVIAALPAMSQGIGGMGMEGISKSEYRYWNFVMGVNLGFGSAMGKSDPNMYLKTPYGDIPQETSGFSMPTAGYHLGFLYNYDLLNNRMGVVAGVEYINYGVQNNHKGTYFTYNAKGEVAKENKVTLKNIYRATGVQIPILFKFSSSDIYRDMKYVCVGIKPIINVGVKQKQIADGWTADNYGGKVDDKNTFAMAATFGFNYSMLNVNVDYMFKEFVKTDDVKGHIFVCISYNLPMTRWLCIHNWTAEKIRRKIKGKSGM